MKKAIASALMLVMACLVVACNSSGGGAGDGGSVPGGNVPGGEITSNGKTLVVYFSATNNTKRVAEYIAEATGGTLFELVPVNPYTSADLSWSTSGSRVNNEHNDESLRDIELVKTTPDNWDEYDTIFIGYPIWWGIAAWPVNNFVKDNDFSGKTVIPFATSASSGIGQSDTLLRDMAGGGNWLAGRRFSSSESKSTVDAWVDGLYNA